MVWVGWVHKYVCHCRKFSCKYFPLCHMYVFCFIIVTCIIHKLQKINVYIPGPINCFHGIPKCFLIVERKKHTHSIKYFLNCTIHPQFYCNPSYKVFKFNQNAPSYIIFTVLIKSKLTPRKGQIFISS